MARIRRCLMVLIMMLIIFLIIWLIVFLPSYEKTVYSKSMAYEYDKIKEYPYGYEGYKGGDGIPVVDASDISQEIPMESAQIFVLKINVQNLKPMGIYRQAVYDVSEADYETSLLKVTFLRTNESYAQYYMATFANGEQIPVLINDRVVNIPNSGEVTLPMGRVSIDSNLLEISTENLSNDRYINAASSFEKSYEMKKFRIARISVAVGLMLFAVICVIIAMVAKRMNKR